VFQKEKEQSNRRFFRFLSDYLLFFALCLFLISTFNPFVTLTHVSYRIGNIPISASYKVTYWSYKAFTSSSGSETYFSSYWFANDNIGISWQLVATFSVQILTMIFALISLVWMRKLRFIPSISSAITIMLMVQINIFTHPGFRDYELGYFFAYPSTFLFLYAVIMYLFSIRNNSFKHKSVLTVRQ
jgi:hypothetical protein